MAAKKFLDYDGLDYYDSKLKEYITTELNDTLEDALQDFSGALRFKGTISSTTTMHSTYPNAEKGDVYFAKTGGVKVTYYNTNGTSTTETMEIGDAIVCLVGKSELSSTGVTQLQWATLQTNWTVENKNYTLAFGDSSTTAVVANVGGVQVEMQVPSASAVVSQLSTPLDEKYLNITDKVAARDSLGLQEIATMNTTQNIGDNPSGNLIPTDLAVKNFLQDKIAESTSGVGDVRRMDYDSDEAKWNEYSVVTDGVARLPNIRMNGSALTEYRDFGTTAVTSSVIVTLGKAATLGTGSIAASATSSVPTGSTVYAYAASKSAEVSNTSVTNGLTVTLGGTIGTPKIKLTFSSSGVTSSSETLVTGSQVASALNGTAFYAPITDEEIDTLF